MACCFPVFAALKNNDHGGGIYIIDHVREYVLLICIRHPISMAKSKQLNNQVKSHIQGYSTKLFFQLMKKEKD